VFERQEISEGEGDERIVLLYEDRGYKWLSVIFQLPLGQYLRQLCGVWEGVPRVYAAERG
jgi:hypothetical protein